MCGALHRTEPVNEDAVAAMARALRHRGPDGEGLHRDGPLALGHRRLSIIDLSHAASEPMSNEDGSLWLIFNGEVYNFRELRRDLEPRHRFKSQTDAEVILHLYAERGEEAVAALDGMFAFALWDAKRRSLLLARDRSGKKPLFYFDGPQLFAFASEVKALLAHPGVARERDEKVLALYLTYGYVPTPGTFYRHIRSLPPGNLMVVTEKETKTPRRYWEARFTSAGRNGDDDGRSDDDAEEQFRTLLRAAVKRRLVADVPLGAFLSGGLDSSSVVAFMAQEAEGRVKTFSIGFVDGGPYDETAHAREVAQAFGTDHTEFKVEPRALELLDRLVYHHDGPFGDSSAVPTFLLAELTRKHVTVALNGDGGDEVFAGYLRFYGAELSERLPRWVFRALRAGLAPFPEPKDRKNPLRLARQFAEAGERPLLPRYLGWNAYFTDDLPAMLRPELRELAAPSRVLESFEAAVGHEGSVLARLLELNFKTYLLDDLNVKVDRMSMAHGLETRSPFLDTALVEFGARLPDRLRMRFGKGKVLLRRAMKDILPSSILKRGKMGFGAPLGTWFRGDLGPFVRQRLLDPASPLYAYLEREPVRQLVDTHMAQKADVSPKIWALLTLESWLRQEAGWGREAQNRQA
jgi:asparagine synthase (glutamine-hydrolysing)